MATTKEQTRINRGFKDKADCCGNCVFFKKESRNFAFCNIDYDRTKARSSCKSHKRLKNNGGEL